MVALIVPQRSFTVQQTETLKKSHYWPECREKWNMGCLVPGEKSTIQPMHPVLREHHRQMDGKNQRTRKFAVGLCLLETTGQLHS